MLKLVPVSKRKAARAELKANLKAALEPRGVRNIGYPGGNFDAPVYSAGDGKLWVAFGEPSSSQPRYSNNFGIFKSGKQQLSETVEINVAVSGRSSGFFAEDADTGDIFLIHSGQVGGGRPGIGKSAFLAWSRAKLIEVIDEKRSRTGIAVAKLGEPGLAGRIWKFVEAVQGFKDEASAGRLETPNFKKRMKEYDRYIKEFSGKKRGMRQSSFEYEVYHGDIVEQLYRDRCARRKPGEGVFNNGGLMDL